MKKYLKLAGISLTIATVAAFPSFAGHSISVDQSLTNTSETNLKNNTGKWVKTNGIWQYFESDGTLAKNKWIKAGSYTYYVGSDGNLVTDSVIEDGDDKYYVDPSGVRFENRWKEMYDDGVYWAYFASSGKMARCEAPTDEAKIRFETIQERTYAFDENGHMIHGWATKADGMLMDEESWKTAEYYFGDENDGSMAKGFRTIDVLNGQGDEEKIFYFDPDDGKKNTAVILNIGTGSYTFSQDGYYLLTGWVPGYIEKKNESNGKTYAYLDGSTRYFSDPGRLKRGTWLYEVPSEELSEEDYREDNYRWFYIGDDGKAVKNQFREINGKTYAFDGIGRMMQGFVLKGNRDVPVSVGETENVTSDLLKQSKLYGMYYFSEDEKDGSMKTGFQTISLSDGDYRFYFENDGSGNAGYSRKPNAYLSCGLILTADESEQYGAVSVDMSKQPYQLSVSFSDVLNENEIKNRYQNEALILIDKNGNPKKNGTYAGENGMKYRTDKNGRVINVQ